ncbi:MAG: hypothetical protein MZV64_28705 [Ignavibacteriales bacterium]|nr:hypothetical protein [Ignavibacteriales bacterium]
MPMPDYKTPSVERQYSAQTWEALKEFIYIAAPVVIISGVVIQAINLAGLDAGNLVVSQPGNRDLAGPTGNNRNSSDIRDTQGKN